MYPKIRATGESFALQSSVARSRSSFPEASRSVKRATKSLGTTRPRRKAIKRSSVKPTVTIEQSASGQSSGLSGRKTLNTLLRETPVAGAGFTTTGAFGSAASWGCWACVREQARIPRIKSPRAKRRTMGVESPCIAAKREADSSERGDGVNRSRDSATLWHPPMFTLSRRSPILPRAQPARPASIDLPHRRISTGPHP